MKKPFKPEPRRVNFILLDGGVGDHIASLVAVDYVMKRYRWITPLVWTPDYLVELAQHLLPKNTYVKSYTDMKEHYNHMITTKTTKWDNVISPMKIPLLDYAFLKLTDENPSLEHKNYLKITVDNETYLDKPYVVVTTGFTARARMFPAQHVNEITSYLISQGITPVFLGQTKTQTGSKHVIEGNFDKGINFNAGIDLRDRTTLLQAAQVMAKAKAVVGVDNGLLHVAGCTNVPIVGGFPSVTPEIRMPVRHNQLGWNFYPVTPDKDKGCDFCQQNTNFLYGHDYRECVKHNDDSVNDLTASKFISHLETILKSDT